ncbi:MAG: ATP-binding protein [Chloroflexota bacterium]
MDNLLRTAMERAQESGQSPDDALRGLFVSWDEAAHDLNQFPMGGLWQGDTNLDDLLNIPHDPDQPLARLIDSFGLTALDGYILLISLAPELDRRYERLYAFLQDDMSIRRASVNLVMNLLGVQINERFMVWERLQPHMPLINYRLLQTQENAEKRNAASLAHTLHVDSRVVGHLLGVSEPDERVAAAMMPPPVDDSIGIPIEQFNAICDELRNAPVLYMKGAPNMGQLSTAQALCNAYNLGMVIFDGAKLNALSTPFKDAWRLMLREAHLNEAALVITHWEALLPEGQTQPDADMWATIFDYHRPVFLCSEKDWEPANPVRSRRMLRMAFDIPDYPARIAAWEQFTDEADIDIDSDILADLSNKFRLPRTNIRRAVNSALDFALSEQKPVNRDHLYRGVQSHISLQLGHLADRIHPKFTWDDLILPPDQMEQLQEITQRARFAFRVQHEWGFIKRISNANGVSALFAGESGTGKTLSVQVIANELGLALYRIDLSAVVSKYIGETEKNLSVIFSEAKSSNAILFFDEADAIFGKRSEVKDAKDRYANIEIAYLLQQIEDYDGVAIMATNLRQNLDEAFTRRIDFMVDFPFPDETYREKLWTVHFPPEAPLDERIDLREVAERYHLAGGNIRNAALAAAYLAAADGGVITYEHLRSAIRREHQKMGRLIHD